VRQPRALARELRILARYQRGLLELVELEAQQVAAVARDTLRGLPLLERRPRTRERVPARAHRTDVRLQAAGRIEQVAMALHATQRLMLVLSVDMQEERRQVAQDRERAERAVHVCPRASAPSDHPSNEELSVATCRDARGAERLTHLRRHVLEECLDHGFLRARPDEVRFRPASERHVERLEAGSTCRRRSRP